jgi:hypothetical protein
VSQSTATSDLNGLASVTASGGGFSPPLEVDVAITAGTGARLDDPLELLPDFANGSTGTPPRTERPPVHTTEIGKGRTPSRE